MHNAHPQERVPARPPSAGEAGGARTVLAVKGSLHRQGALEHRTPFRQSPEAQGGSGGNTHGRQAHPEFAELDKHNYRSPAWRSATSRAYADGIALRHPRREGFMVERNGRRRSIWGRSVDAGAADRRQRRSKTGTGAGSRDGYGAG